MCNTGDTSSPSRDAPLVIAHRGASLVAPENTLPAFEMAIAAGADMIETDAQLTVDRQVVLTHDSDLRRISGAAGRVGDLRATEIRAHDAGFCFRPAGENITPFRGRGVRVPTLNELLDLLEAHASVRLNLEIKAQDDASRTRQLVALAIDILTSRGIRDRVLLSSFDSGALDAAQSIDPHITTALLVGPHVNIDAAIIAAAEAGHRAIHPNDASVNNAIIEAAHRRGLLVNVWTVDSAQRMRELIVAGADGIITNDPLRLRSLLDRERPKS